MKKLLLFLLISFFSFQGIAQDPDLFRTWYLHILDVDGAPTYVVSEISPSIVPTLIILETLDFNGDAACNIFFGIYELSSSETLLPLEFEGGVLACDYQIHDLFENAYFGFLGNEVFFTITQDGNGLELLFNDAFVSWALFKDYPPLSTPDFNLSQIKVYPNPAQDVLRIDNTNHVEITSIKIYDVLGRHVMSVDDRYDEIDVSHLNSGMLFVEIETDQGRVTKKIIKE